MQGDTCIERWSGARGCTGPKPTEGETLFDWLVGP
jgi:hypothetical protein